MLTIALIGADGAGKTTLARRLEHELPMPAMYLYMGENPEASEHVSPPVRLIWALRRRRQKLPATGGPPPVPGMEREHDGGAAGLRGWFHVGILLLEEWYRQWVAWRHVRRGTVVLYDRHFIADYHAHDVVGEHRSASRRLHGYLLRRVYPQPQLTIVLDAPAQVLFARKAEGTIEALASRRQEYLDFAAADPTVEVLDVDRPVDAVEADLVALITARAGRGATRLAAT